MDPTPQKFVFADEAGCFAFNREPNVSKYFILCTITMNDCAVGNALVELRRELAWREAPLRDFFHATYDQQIVRDAVFETICAYDFTVQATIMEKAKAQPHIRETRQTFYKFGWYYHFKNGIVPLIEDGTAMLVSAAAIGIKKEKASFASVVDDVLQQTAQLRAWNTDFPPSSADPCLQVADYCAWAMYRKWERGDVRSYNLIKDRITREYDLWSRGTTLYY